MKNIALVIFDYFDYGGIQKDLDALGKMLHQLAKQRGIPLKLTLLCMHNLSGTSPEWCDEVAEMTPPWYLMSNHRRAKWFDRKLAELRAAGKFDLLVGFNRTGSLDFYFAGDDCLKERYRHRAKISALLPRGKTFLALEHRVFTDPASGGASKIFIITEKQRASFLENYPECSPERLLMMPPNLAPEYFDHSGNAELRKQTRAEFAVNDNTLLFIQIAAAFHTKGVDRSVELLGIAKQHNIVSDFKFVVVGGTSDTVRSEMLKLARNCGLTADEICFTGPRQDIRRLLCGADMMIHPARAEATGGVLIEALASGVPALSSAVCGYNTFIEQADAGVIIPEPYSEASAQSALEFALTNLQQLRTAASNYAAGISPEKFQRARSEAIIILEHLA